MSALKLKKGASRKSAYDLRDYHEQGLARHTLTILVDNEAGVLSYLEFDEDNILEVTFQNGDYVNAVRRMRFHDASSVSGER